MKTFKEFLEEGFADKYLDQDHVPQVNHPGEIKDYSHEAKRQLNFFGRFEHEDYDEPEPPPHPISSNFLGAHNLQRHWDIDEIEAKPHEVARHLDLYHKYYPEIARHYNLRPMSPENIEDDTGAPSPHK